jgi:hypothetical protein
MVNQGKGEHNLLTAGMVDAASAVGKPVPFDITEAGCYRTPGPFFTTSRFSEAVVICRPCPHKDECGEYGETQQFGVWGGTIPVERGFRFNGVTETGIGHKDPDVVYVKPYGGPGRARKEGTPDCVREGCLRARYAKGTGLCYKHHKAWRASQ